jgi:hypothetical protein
MEGFEYGMNVTNKTGYPQSALLYELSFSKEIVP